jgi:hypothetical protein
MYIRCLKIESGYCASSRPLLVMPGLVPGIHVFRAFGSKDVDGRDKPGHDDGDQQANAYSALLTSLMRGELASISLR